MDNEEISDESKVTKKVRVKVTTPKGDKYLTYDWYSVKQMEETHDSLCNFCPYSSSICDNLADPRNPDDPNSSFTDFCTELDTIDLENGKQVNLSYYHPEEGTIEKELDGVIDISQCTIQRGRRVKLEDVIDCVCPDCCDMYKKDHSGCTQDINTCILKELFKKK
jgi:hypothetical protein